MNAEELEKEYRIRADSELLRLALTPEQLTPEANAALVSELARRGIADEVHPNLAREQYSEHNLRPSGFLASNFNLARLVPIPLVNGIRESGRRFYSLSPLKQITAMALLMVAVGIGVPAIRNFIQDDEHRHQAIHRALEEQAFNRYLAVPVRDEENAAWADVKRYEAKVRNDRLIGEAAIVFLMISLAIFSTASHHADAVRAERTNKT